MVQEIKSPLSSVVFTLLILSQATQNITTHAANQPPSKAGYCPLQMSESQGGQGRGWQEIRLRHHTLKLSYKRSCQIRKHTSLCQLQPGEVRLIILCTCTRTHIHYCHHAVNKTGGDITTVTSPLKSRVEECRTIFLQTQRYVSLQGNDSAKTKQLWWCTAPQQYYYPHLYEVTTCFMK